MKALNYLLLIAGVIILNLELYVMSIEKLSKTMTINPEIIKKVELYYESSGPVTFLAIVIIILAFKGISKANKA